MMIDSGLLFWATLYKLLNGWRFVLSVNFILGGDRKPLIKGRLSKTQENQVVAGPRGFSASRSSAN